MTNTDTICAIATPMGVGGIGVIRISGEHAESITSALTSADVSAFPDRAMILCTADTGKFKDKCLVVCFRAPHSYTGETVVEIHCHGGRALVVGMLSAVIKGGARLARNGEFTMRAFINGKVSLSESEGIIDMINSQSDAEINAGYNLATGRLTDITDELQDRLTDIICELEVVLDYPEEDIETYEITEKLIGISTELTKLSNTFSGGKLLKNGVNVAVIGKPNVGKSSLLNSLLQFDRAIVTDIAGTTRDTISETIELDGIKFNLIDTAGIRESSDAVEKAGVERSKNAILSADIVIYVYDGSQEFSLGDKEVLEFAKDKKIIYVCNKSDLATFKKNRAENLKGVDIIAISARENKGIDTLKDKLISTVNLDKISQGGLILTNQRHYDIISRAKAELDQLLANSSDLMPDIIAMTVRSVWDILGELTGTTASEEIINRIFEKFCLGK